MLTRLPWVPPDPISVVEAVPPLFAIAEFVYSAEFWFWFLTAMFELTFDCDACCEFIPLEFCVFVPDVRLPRESWMANWGSFELFVAY